MEKTIVVHETEPKTAPQRSFPLLYIERKKIEQVMVTENQRADFETRVNWKLEEGFSVVPGSVIVAMGEPGMVFIAILEKCTIEVVNE